MPKAPRSVYSKHLLHYVLSAQVPGLHHSSLLSLHFQMSRADPSLAHPADSALLAHDFETIPTKKSKAGQIFHRRLQNHLLQICLCRSPVVFLFDSFSLTLTLMPAMLGQRYSRSEQIEVLERLPPAKWNSRLPSYNLEPMTC